jgi:hypothetical protein
MYGLQHAQGDYRTVLIAAVRGGLLIVLFVCMHSAALRWHVHVMLLLWYVAVTYPIAEADPG